MPNIRRIWTIIRRVWITVGVAGTIVFILWSLIAFRATSTARKASVSNDRVVVNHQGGVWSFTPRDSAHKSVRLVFISGALVDPRAYAPLAQTIARAGYPVTVVELPRRGAFGGATSDELARRVRTSISSDDGRAVVLGVIPAVLSLHAKPLHRAGQQ